MRLSRALITALLVHALPALAATPAMAESATALAEQYASNDPQRIRNGDPFEPAATLDPAAKQAVQRIPGCSLRTTGPVPQDATNDTGIMPFHKMVEAACELDAKSDRVTLVPGWQAHSGRDIFAVHVTAPSPDVQRNSEAVRERLVTDPAGLAADLKAGKVAPWRPTVMVSANIHGSEGEGTDTVMAWATYLANAKDTDPLVEGSSGGPTVGAFLNAYELVLIPSVNPDGRTAGTRRNAAGIDLNRDQVARSQPETVALQALLQRYQPVMHLDLHGYYNPNGNALGLVEPAGTPHAIAMDRPRLEARMNNWLSRLDANIINRPEVKAMGFDAKRVGIAMKDEPNGRWDDWAPVYTSVWSTLMNGAGVTVEAPFNPFGRPLVNGKNAAAQGNIAFMRGAVDAMALAAMDTREALITSLVDYRVQAAAGERGSTGQDWPQGWVIDGPDPQHPKANRDHLVENLKGKGVQFKEFPGGVTIGDKTYQPGAVYVPANQPYRALAAVTLSPGGTVPGDRTTDLAAWSPGSLWGATVETVAHGAKVEPNTVPRESPGTQTPEAQLRALGPGPWRFIPRSIEQVRAINELVNGGVALYRNPADGNVYIPGEHGNDILKYVSDLALEPVTDMPDRVERIRKLKVGITADGSSTNWLQMLGYAPVFVDITNAAAIPNDLDVLILNRHVGAEVGTKIGDWVRKGGALVAIDGGQYMLPTLGITSVKTMGLGRRSAGLLEVTQDASEPVMPGRLPKQVELTEPYQVWPSLPEGFHAVQTVPVGATITSGVWPEHHKTSKPAYLTIAGGVNEGRVVASGAQRVFRHHMVGQADELFDWMHWASKPSLVDNPLRITERIAGSDRVETALALSTRTHPKTADTVVITAADAWADTLVAGPLAAAHNAPILLSNRQDVRPSVLARLGALAPKRIIVVGGREAVSDAVLTQLRALAGSPTIERIGGVHRYDTSAAVAATFPAGSQTYVATGDQPADALIGGVLAARNKGVTLLVPTKGAVPPKVIQETKRLADPELTILGGTQAVPEDTARVLASSPTTAARIAGANRFETAAVVAKQLAPARTVAVVNGYSTADALLATPFIHQRQGAILLSDTNALPKVTADTLATLKPNRVVLIGGEQVLTQQVAQYVATP